jgi:FkbM family methyltransferase
MTLALPNPATRFPQAVAPLLNQKEQQYVLIDIGARDGMDPLWQSFHDILDFIGFEPDPKECAQLNADAQKYGNTRHRIYPHAIAGTEGPRPFYVTRFAFSSGLHKGNPAWLERFPFTNLDVLREIEITTTSLDKFCFQQSLDHVDFIKIDVEGAEYDVLEGSLNMLASQKVLGIKTEFWQTTFLLPA